MRKRNEPKPIQGWGWLGDAAEEAAVEATAPARRLKDASTATAAVNGKHRTGVAQLGDDEYRRLAEQQYESEDKIEIDPHGRVSRSETGAWVQAWVFVYKPER